MDSIKRLVQRDEASSNSNQYSPSMGSLALTFFTLVVIGSVLSLALLFMRRRRLVRQQALLPRYNPQSHHRSVSVTNLPHIGQNDRVFIYDEKMNLIANSSSPPSSPVPEIRVTFPDDEDKNGQASTGRVVVVHVTDTGSIGMSPYREQLPPYQHSDAERFQSLDLERIGGLREKETPVQRFS